MNLEGDCRLSCPHPPFATHLTPPFSFPLLHTLLSPFYYPTNLLYHPATVLLLSLYRPLSPPFYCPAIILLIFCDRPPSIILISPSFTPPAIALLFSTALYCLAELCDRVQQLVGGVASMERLIADAPGQ